MRLIKLSANQASFKTVNFRREGVSIIRAKKDDTKKKNLKGTYNGVGKSLIIKLIHFCLGSNAVEEFSRKLPDYVFALDFEIDGVVHTVKRGTIDQGQLILNGKKAKLSEIKDLIEKHAFEIPDDSKNLTARSLISRFLRQRKESYIGYDKFIEEEKEHISLLNNGFLLGLDILLILRKIQLKEQFDKIEKMQQALEKDDIFKKYFVGDGELDIDMFDLEVRIKNTEENISNFKIAENFSIIKDDTDVLSREIAELKNQLILEKNRIKHIDACLEQKPDIAAQKVIDLYNEARIYFPAEALARIDQITKFHDQLLKNRVKRLIEERRKIEDKAAILEVKHKQLGKKFDENLEFLNTHGALGELETLNKKLSSIKSEYLRLKTYSDLLKSYEEKRTEVEAELLNQNTEAKTYLEQIKPTIWTQNMTFFRDISARFYDDKAGGITIKNNTGTNRVRFDINAKISDDASDGINEVKIFCFDFLLLHGQHNHSVSFIFHDSRILSDMDPRQRATLFRIANEMTRTSGFQYIISANEDALESMREHLNTTEYEEFVDRNVILELTDQSPESKLLGIDIDMDYEK